MKTSVKRPVSRPDAPALPGCVFPIRKVEGAKEAMLCIHPGGLPSKVYARLAEAMPDVSVYVAELSVSMPYVQASEPGADHDGGVERVARSVIDDFGKVCGEPVGILCGWSFGGVIAHRLAQEIVAGGRPQPMVILLDTIAPVQAGPLDRLLPFSAKSLAAGAREKPVLMRWFVSYLNALRGCRISVTAGEIARLSEQELLERLLDRLKSAGGMGQDVTMAGFAKVFREFSRGMNRNTSLLAQYVPGGAEIDIVLIRASKPLYRIFHVFRRMGWGRLARSVEARTIRGDHYQLIADPDCIQAISKELKALRDGR